MRKPRSPFFWVSVSILLIVLIAVGGTAYTVWAAGRITGQQTLVMAPEVVQPESAPLIRAIVQDFNTGEPIPRAAVTMRLVSVEGGESLTLYEGRTAEDGSVAAQVKLPEGLEGAQAVVDLGLPPGFAVLDEDLALLVERGVISRYELAARQIIIYLEDFSSKEPLEFAYRLRAKYPLKAKSPASQAYDYYTPDRQGDQRPTEIVVNE